MSFDLLMERYLYTGVDPLEDWSTEDLAELEIIINAELQERSMKQRPDYDFDTDDGRWPK